MGCRPCVAQSAISRRTSIPRACRAIHWHLAPLEMGWQDRTLGEICAQIKDPARNGNRSLEALIEHIREEPLVSWAWAPGYGRQPAPGMQKEAAELVEAWVHTGAVCPTNTVELFAVPYQETGNEWTPKNRLSNLYLISSGATASCRLGTRLNNVSKAICSSARASGLPNTLMDRGPK